MINFSAPSKTFLVGEYAALVGGPCLLLNTEPRFEGKIDPDGNGECVGIHPKSPAGVWVRAHRDDFANINFEFVDPHEGRGGFGASGAQFLFVWAWSHLQNNRNLQQALAVDPRNVLSDFLSFFSDQANPPSGADVVSQTVGGVLNLNMRPFSTQKYEWPFAELDFLVVPTGVKLPTHNHLKTLNDQGLKRLRDLSATVVESFKRKAAMEFISNLQNFADELSSQGKVADHTMNLLQDLRTQDGVKVVKGCGAMGSDVVLVVVDKEKKLAVTSRLQEMGKTPLADGSAITTGLSLTAEMHRRAYMQVGLSYEESPS